MAFSRNLVSVKRYKKGIKKMRWSKKGKKQWDIGNQRVKKKFLFLPKCLPESGRYGTEKQWRWFERAEILQELLYFRHMPVPFIRPKNKWKNTSWSNY